MPKGMKTPLYRLKYYRAIAEQMRILANLYADDVKGLQTINNVVDNFIFAFACDNPRFKEKQFRRLCGDLIHQDCITLETAAELEIAK